MALKTHLTLILALILFSALWVTGSAGTLNAAERAQTRTSKLRVVTKPLEPFVIKDGDRWTGFSIDLWEKIAQELKLDYEFVEVKTVADQLNAVEQGKADAAMAGISMTPEREQRVDFSHPYFNAGLQVMTSARGSQSLTGVLSSIFSPPLLQIIAIGLVVVFVMANIVWLIERRVNPDFPKGYWRGVWEALWWSVGVIATGEYGGDKPTQGTLRRLLTIFYWFLGIVLIAHFTATITSQLTVEQLSGTISGPSDLPGKRIASVQGTTAAKYLTGEHLDFTEVTRIEDAYALLETGQVDAVVYDAPVLLYYAATKGKGKTLVVGPIFKRETYGIALQTGNPLRKRINEELLKLNQDGTYQEIYDKWFGKSE